MKTSYTAVYNRHDVYRGDTISGWSVVLAFKDNGDPIIPASASMQLQNSSGKIVHDFDVTVNPDDGRVTIGPCPPEVTQKLRPGTYKDVLHNSVEN